MKKRRFLVALTVALIFVAAACVKKESEAPPQDSSAALAVDPENLGQKVGSSYVETLKQVVAVMNDKPPAADVKAMLADLKSWTIELMVGLGREREALSEADRAVVDRVLSQRISGVPAELFKEYQAGQQHYKDDPELFRLIADFNIITQYANFDLLKKQLPEEAKRLGIE